VRLCGKYSSRRKSRKRRYEGRTASSTAFRPAARRPLAVGGGEGRREVGERFVEVAFLRRRDGVRCGGGVDAGDRHPRRRHAAREAAAHERDRLVEDARKLAQPREVVLVVLDRRERHLVGELRELGVEARVGVEHQLLFTEPARVEPIGELGAEEVVAHLIRRRQRRAVDLRQRLEEGARLALAPGEGLFGRLAQPVVARVHADVGGEQRALRQAHRPLLREQGVETLRLVGAHRRGHRNSQNRPEDQRRSSSHAASPRKAEMLAQAPGNASPFEGSSLPRAEHRPWPILPPSVAMYEGGSRLCAFGTHSDS
jgi:hypothetical protein